MKLRGLSLLLAVLASPAHGEDGADLTIEKLPAKVRPFVEKGAHPLFIGSADLNGDGRADFLLVLEKDKAPSGDETLQGQRPLLILTRQPDGALKLARRNDRVVYCSTCGGAMGDPFQPPSVGTKTFSVSAYGGSAWRWSVDYRFNYSRRDDAWQLVRVEESNFHASEPDSAKSKVYTPPKDFGKIDIGDFDPENWKGRGEK
jgi:hypothetical protein